MHYWFIMFMRNIIPSVVICFCLIGCPESSDYPGEFPGEHPEDPNYYENELLTKITDALNKGEDINKISEYRSTYLHLAAGSNYRKCLRLLLDNGADVNFRDTRNEATPLHEAVSFSKLAAVKILLENGADLEAKNRFGWTPIMKFFFGSHGHQLDVLSYLIEVGANLDARNSYGSSVLHLSAHYGSADEIELLIASGAKINSVSTNFGNIPLHVAVEVGRLEISELLLQNGSNVNARNNQGNTPLSIALHHGDPDRYTPKIRRKMAKLIRSYGGIE